MLQNSRQSAARSGSAAVQLLAVAACATVCLLTGLQIARFESTSPAAAPAADTLSAEPTSAPTETRAAEEAVSSESPRSAEPEYHTERVRGRVVFLAAALKEEFGISTVDEVAEHSLALQTPDGSLLPLVENLRGRAFRKDDRLRDRDLELLVRRYRRQPFVQILRMYEVEDGRLLELDYWCDVCAIVMFETGPCACCQDDNRLRRRPVDEAAAD